MLIGVSWLMLKPPGTIDRRNEVPVHISTAVCIAYIAMMASYNSMYGVGGVLFWTFIGLRLSGRLWSADDLQRVQRYEPISPQPIDSFAAEPPSVAPPGAHASARLSP